MLRTISEAEISSILDTTTPFSDRGRVGLEAWAREFVGAHQRVPGGLTIEIGTRVGGSAALWALLSDRLYGPGKAPPLWTIDPYGSKPYEGGDVGREPAPIYDSAMYAAMKDNLKNVAFHAHWLMTSDDFFRRMAGVSYWQPGERTHEVVDIRTGGKLALPIGEERRAGPRTVAFALVDGAHTEAAIVADFKNAADWLAPGGTVVVDNTDTDPKTLPVLREIVRAWSELGLGRGEFSADAQWLVWRRGDAALLRAETDPCLMCRAGGRIKLREECSTHWRGHGAM